MIALLRGQANFRLLWIGQVVSQVGDRVFSLALLWLVYQWTSSGLAVGVVMVATSLPGVLVGPLAGGFADRWNRQWLLVGADLGRAVVCGWLAWRAASGALDFPELLTGAALLSIGAAFFNPTALALLPNLVPPADLTRANAMNQLSANSSGVLGPVLGSGLIAAVGAPFAFAVDALSYVWSAGCEAALRLPPTAHTPTQSVWADLRTGWQAAASQPLVMRMLAPAMAINFFFTALVVLAPVLAEGVYHGGAAVLGALMAAFALGMLGGALLLSLLPGTARRGPWVVAGTIGSGVAFLLMGTVLWLPVTLLGLAGIGLGLNAANINLITVYQRLIPDELRGKVFGLLVALSLSLQPVAYGVMGWLTEVLSPQTILLLSGAVITLSGLSLLRIPALRTV